MVELDCVARLRAASAALESVRDVVDERPDGARAPSWCVRRGWGSFLASLSPEDVLDAERDGLAARVEGFAGAPRDLVALAATVRAVTSLPDAGAPAVAGEVASTRASPRKRAQVAAFAGLVMRLAPGAARIVDVGAGHGHLTRHLAAALGVSAEGWERDPARVAVANRLTLAGGARFVTIDVGAGGSDLATGDVVVGLHACGELGDTAVLAASAAGADLALIGCCLQKREGARRPLSRVADRSAGRFDLQRSVLGLANARDGEQGVEEDLVTRARARCARFALRALLLEHGEAVVPGEEMRGVNRRRATGSLDDLVARAFRGRGLSPPDADQLARAAAEAAVAHALERRFSLPRTMLARLVEVWVALDRAAFLAERGYAVELVRAFDEAVSPRNIALLARAKRPRPR